MTIKPLVLTPVNPPKFHNGNPYPTMGGNTPFAKRFNELQSEAWVLTGTYYPSDDLITQILIERYDKEPDLD